MRDVITTIGGLVVVALVVVATFLYGNSQREEQQKRDQQAQEEQTSKDEASVNQSQQPSPQEGAKPDQPLQGGQKPGVGGASTPNPASGRTPETGGEILVLLPAAAMVLAFRAKKRSDQAVRFAALNS